jgi:hypothetical protein
MFNHTNQSRRNFFKSVAVGTLLGCPILAAFYRSFFKKNNSTWAGSGFVQKIPCPEITQKTLFQQACLSPQGDCMAVSAGALFGRGMIFATKFDKVLNYDFSFPVDIMSASCIISLALSNGPDFKLAYIVREIQGPIRKHTEFDSTDAYFRYVGSQKFIDNVYFVPFISNSNPQNQPILLTHFLQDISPEYFLGGLANYKISWIDNSDVLLSDDRRLLSVSIATKKITELYLLDENKGIRSNLFYDRTSKTISFLELLLPVEDDESPQEKYSYCETELVTLSVQGEVLKRKPVLTIPDYYNAVINKKRQVFVVPQKDGTHFCSAPLDAPSKAKIVFIKNTNSFETTYVPYSFWGDEDSVFCGIKPLDFFNDEVASDIEKNHNGYWSSLAKVFC